MDSIMRSLRFVALGLAMSAALAAGCATSKNHRSAYSGEPPLDMGSGTTGTLAQGSTGHPWVDRHPLLYKPGEVYHNTGHGPIVKTGAAILVGVPVGVAHEVKNIFVGVPRTTY
jgi:hypothetical protein